MTYGNGPDQPTQALDTEWHTPVTSTEVIQVPGECANSSVAAMMQDQHPDAQRMLNSRVEEGGNEMDSFPKQTNVMLQGYWLYLWLSIVCTLVLVLLMRRRKCSTNTKTKYPANTVILHQLPVGPSAPSLSPFCLKLETYLRMAGIPHQSERDGKFSSKGKMPWIEYNGEVVADSQFCIDYLKEMFGDKANLNKHLDSKDLAISQAFQRLIEDSLHVEMPNYRFLQGDERFIDFTLKSQGMPRFFMRLAQRKVKRNLWGQGFGRHERQEQIHIIEKNLRALSTFLGKKKFFMGDEPSELDAALFGSLSQFTWCMLESPAEKLIKGELHNLEAYCETMKRTYWPDWEQCITGSWTSIENNTKHKHT